MRTQALNPFFYCVSLQYKLIVSMKYRVVQKDSQMNKKSPRNKEPSNFYLFSFSRQKVCYLHACEIRETSIDLNNSSGALKEYY
jgi:hypothetical protein